MADLSYIEIEPPSSAQASVIWLHGLGANGHDFVNLIPELNLPSNHGIRFIFPHAPRRPVTLNMGYVMPAWYDIFGLTLETREDAVGIPASAQAINQLIDREIARGIASDKIILAGFSQGGAMALHTGLRYPKKLAGILVLSAYLPLAAKVAAEASTANQHIDIAIMHGAQDNVVPAAWGELSRDRLLQLNYSVNWQTFDMAHSVCLEEIRAIAEWFKIRID